MAPLLNRVAKKYPDLGRDAALARIGRENFKKYATEQPLDYAWMVIRKIQNMWDRGSSAGDVAPVLVRLPQGARVLGARGADRARLAARAGRRCRSA